MDACLILIYAFVTILHLDLAVMPEPMAESMDFMRILPAEVNAMIVQHFDIDSFVRARQVCGNSRLLAIQTAGTKSMTVTDVSLAGLQILAGPTE